MNFGGYFPCALGLSASIGFYTVSFFTDSKQYLTGIKTELSFATETINQTRLEPRSGKLRKCMDCLLYSSGGALESVAQSLCMLTINEDKTANVYLYQFCA